MGKRSIDREKVEFKPQSYFRLLSYAKPYWKRLTVGILAGFVVGGSLFGSLLVVGDMMVAVDPGMAKKENQRKARELVKKIGENPNEDPAVAAERIEALLQRQLSKQELAEQRETKKKAREIVLAVRDGADLSPAEKAKKIAQIMQPERRDPKLEDSLKRLRKYADVLHIPVEISKDTIKINSFIKFSLPVANEVGNMSWQFFSIYVFLFVFGWTLKNIATYINRYYTRWVGAKVIADLRNAVFEKLMGQSLSFYGRMDIGQLISRCTNDTAAIESSVANTIADATRCPIEIMACVAAIVIASWKYNNFGLLIILFIGLPVCVLPVIILGRHIRTIYKRAFKKIAEVVTRMHETFTGIMVVKACHTEALEMTRFRQTNRRYFRTIVHVLKMQLFMAPLMEIVAVASTLVFLIFSYSRGVTLTELATLLIPAFMAYQPIKSLAKITTYLQRSMAAADRYFDLLDTDTEMKDAPDARELEDFEYEISFEDVCFSYEAGKRVLDGINFEIKKGSVVAVVGETGSGKTTIANMIARFYDPVSGKVCIDGRDIREFTMASLRQHIGIVTQTPVLFNETIAENIAYGCPEASEIDIIEAAKQANAHQFITDGRHQDGYQTVVGEKGFKLSGGEKQRIAIARSILKNPPILILDEATSALDTVTERLVQEALNRVMSNRTVFAIAHRLSTIQHADMIIVLDKGKIVERGTHDQLLAQNGLYKRLHDTQFQSASA